MPTCLDCCGTGKRDRPEELGGSGNGEWIACSECEGEGVIPLFEEQSMVRSIRHTPMGWVADGRVGATNYQVDPVETREEAIREAEILEKELWRKHG